MSSRYITSTIAYVNADPHIGYAVELLQADVLARSWRLQGHDVFFNTGADEHGQKIWEAANKKGENVQAYVDHYAGELRKLAPALSLSSNNFIRTTSQEHARAAQEMWRRCEAAGDIYKKSYTGLYCVGCEAFKTERELEDGRCILHPNLDPQEITEENYFFRFSKYEKRLLDYLSSDAVIIPDWRREEAIAFVESGLADFSISREKTRLPWGVPVQKDDSQVYYVWFDALTSYLSTLGWPADEQGLFEKFWLNGTTVQVAGKDQVRFQSLMWQAMLFSADIKNTDQVFYHGFINSGGQRMSKSLGNVISPYDLVEKYGTDATRYLLLRHVHPTEDSDVTWERLDEWYTANLVNGLGNFVARVLRMSEEHLSEEYSIGQYSFAEFVETSSKGQTLVRLLDRFAFDKTIDLAFEEITYGDELIAKVQPFKLIKEEPEKAKEVMRDLMQRVWRVAVMLKPFMPATSDAILDAVIHNRKPENLFPRLDK